MGTARAAFPFIEIFRRFQHLIPHPTRRPVACPAEPEQGPAAVTKA
jgi:hypothetical protein